VARYVLDANVVVKWWHREIHWQQAAWLLNGDHDFIAPDLVVIEVLNALLQKFRRRETTESVVREAEATIQEAVLLYPVDRLISPALALSVSLGINFYDAIYLALAEEQNCQLVTDDGGLIRATRFRFGDIVLPLGDLPIV
jgi:predicted nucleic acid-binding protein